MLNDSYKTDYHFWFSEFDPDDNVYNSLSYYAVPGDYFFNSVTTDLFVCIQQGENSQVWNLLPYMQDVIDMIDAIPQADWTQGNSASSDYIKNKPTIPAAQVQSDWAQSNSGAIDFIKNKPSAPAARSQSSQTRTLNSAYQISSTRDSLVNYSVDIETSISLTGGQSGTVFLEIASDSGFTTNVQELGRSLNAQTGTLTIGLNITQNITGNLNGYVPSGYYVRLRTQNNTGTPTYTYLSGQEVLL